MSLTTILHMKKTVIAFDVDGTLIKDDNFTPNTRIVELLKILSSFKNTKIIVWSGRGLYWVEQAIEALQIEDYIDGIRSKNHKGKIDGKHVFEPDIVPDIAIDDIQACELGLLNLIVREK